MAQSVSRLPVSTDARVRSQTSTWEVFGGENGTRTGFSLNSSTLPYRCHSTNAPYSSLSDGRFHTRDEAQTALFKDPVRTAL
jgi:hypothetical protein